MEDSKNLAQEIKSLNRTLKAANRPRTIFLKALINGAGAAIGATLIAALGLTLAASLLRATGLDRLLPEQINQAFGQE